MLLNKENMAKMSEAYIHERYSEYLQRVTIVANQHELADSIAKVIDAEFFLSYDEFKEYHISNLIGKTNYLDSIIFDLQYRISDH